MSLGERLAAAQVRRPGLFVLGALLCLGVAAPFAAQIRLNGDFTALLPDSKRSVRDLDEIQRRLGGKATLTVMTRSEDISALRRFASDLAPRIEALETEGVLYVDWNVGDFIDFAERNRWLYADIDDLEEIYDVLYARLRWEVAKANPLVVSLADEPPPDPEEALEDIEARAKEARSRFDQYPEGFFQHPDRPLIAIFVRTSIKGGESNALAGLISAIEREVEALGHVNYAEDLEFFYGGDLMDIKEESEALTQAVVYATLITIVLVLLSIYFFFLRVRAIPLLAAALIPPVVMTFAVAFLAVEYLNASTAFLSSIVVGNGINPNVIWLSRFFEERRSGRSLALAVARTHAATWAATLTASAAAGLAYGSLVITDFRGFRDFGVIGGTGMALCWLAAFLLLPAVVVLVDRWRPLTPAEGGSEDERAGIYGVVFAALAARQPRAVLVAAGVAAVLSVLVVVQAVSENPLEFDFRKLQSTRAPDSKVQWVNDRQGEIVNETLTGSSIAILLDDRTDTSTVVAQLRRLERETPKAFGPIRTLDDFVPKEQGFKLELLEELRDLIPKLKEYADEKQQARLDDNTPPEDIEPISIRDLPASVARPFQDREGRAGQVIFIEHHPERNGWDGKYLVEWAGAARKIRLANGSEPPVVGQPPVFADLLDAIFDDGPRAVSAAFLATVLLVLLTFRRASERIYTIVSLLLGILWMAALMAAGGMKLNFLNFVAFPITFGNGVDYGVNVMRRYVQELELNDDRVSAMVTAVRGSGGAVVLCSLTTIIGYISLYTSSNRALNSFGAAMAISEVTCVIAGVLVLPAALLLSFGRKSNPRA
ncbi:MAG: MMPL family transporter [Myxococcota bacterium]